MDDRDRRAILSLTLGALALGSLLRALPWLDTAARAWAQRGAAPTGDAGASPLVGAFADVGAFLAILGLVALVVLAVTRSAPPTHRWRVPIAAALLVMHQLVPWPAPAPGAAPALFAMVLSTAWLAGAYAVLLGPALAPPLLAALSLAAPHVGMRLTAAGADAYVAASATGEWGRAWTLGAAGSAMFALGPLLLGAAFALAAWRVLRAQRA